MPIHPQRAIKKLLLLTTALAVVLIALTVVFFVTAHAPPDGTDNPKRPIGTAHETDADLPVGAPGDGVTLPETPDAGLTYQDSLIFVGDSLTAHMINRGVLTGGAATTQVWRTESNMLNLKPGITAQKIIFPGPGEQTGTTMTVADAAALAQPRLLIITLGTDWGVAYLGEEDFKACYAEFIRGIKIASPDTTVLLQSIFPVTADCKVLNNQQINLANKWVKAVAADTGCYYLDTRSVLTDEEGCLKAAYCVAGDGIHLNEAGYEAILTYIRTHAVKTD